MIGSKILYGIYNSIKNGIISIFYFIRNFKEWYSIKLADFKNYINDFKFRFSNLSESNFELGMYHLYRQNLNDAIFRFKLIDKFFAPNDQRANYWLGWTYFLKNKLEKAIYHLEKSKDFDFINLKDFIQNYLNYNEVPPKIWQQYRNLTAENYFKDNFLNDNINLPQVFIQKTLEKISNLPDNYSILEIGSNIGLIGNEIQKRFPDNFTLTGIESSEKMLELMSLYYTDPQLYDHIIAATLQDFIIKSSNKEADNPKFDMIISFYGLTFSKELKNYFQYITTLLNAGGYFSLCIPTSNNTNFSLKRKEFIFNPAEIKDIILTSKLNLLYSEELILGNNNKCSIFICKKL